MEAKKVNLMIILMSVFIFCFANSLSADTVGDWQFDEGTGTTTYDSSTYSNDGTLSNQSMWTTYGRVGSALSFDGANYVDCGNDTSLNITGNISFGGWVYYTELVNFAGIIRMGGTYVRREDTGKFKFVFSGLSDDAVQSTTQPVIGKWYHIMGTYDGANIRVYVNGEEEACEASSGTLTGLGTSSVQIGKWNSIYHKGKIDEVKIYNELLSAEEVREIYLEGCVAGNWSFEEGTGTTAYDSSVYSNDGTLTNQSMWTTSGRVGSALNFDGSNYVDCGNDASLDINGNISFGGWVYYTDLIDFAGIICMGSTYVRREDTGEFRFLFTGLTDGSISSTTQPTTGKWYHIMGTYDGANIRVYVDGVEEACEASTGTLNGLGTSSVQIGRLWGNYHKGKIDEVKVYNKALSPEEIHSLYLDGYTVGNWNFNEGTGSTVYDSSVYCNDGTLSNQSMWTTSGRVGSALSFDGTNYVDCGNDASLDISGNISFGGWVYYTELVNFAGIIRMGGTYVRREDTGKFKFVFSGLTDDAIQSTTQPVVGKWYHIMGTYNGANIRVYVNGEEEARETSTGTLTGLGTNSVQMGKWCSIYHKGKIDEFKIYNKALSHDEIYSDYLYGLTGVWKKTYYPYTYHFSLPSAPKGYLLAEKNYLDEISQDTALTVSDNITLSTFATPGEYEPVSFVIYAKESLSSVSVSASNLVSGANTISNQNIDIRYGMRIPRRKTYLAPASDFKLTTCFLRNFNSLNILEGAFREIYITIKVPETAVSGIYSSQISISPQGKSSSTIDLELEVLPFELRTPPNKKYGVYYHLNKSMGTTAVANLELQDMKAHGLDVIFPTLKITYSTVGGNIVANYDTVTSGLTLLSSNGFDDMVVIDTALIDLAAEMGYNTSDSLTSAQKEQLASDLLNDTDFMTNAQNAVQGLITVQSNFSEFDIVLTNLDEVFGYGRLPLYKALTTAAKQVSGFRYYITFDTSEDHESMRSEIDPYVDIRNHHISWEWWLARDVDNTISSYASELNTSGDEAGAYYNPTGVHHSMEWQRIIMGIKNWIGPFTYQIPYIYNYIHNIPFSDLEILAERRDPCIYAFYDSGENIVIPTKIWEGFREGIDDMKYLYTLEDVIDEKRTAKPVLAQQAEDWLATVASSIPSYEGLPCDDPTLNSTPDECPFTNAIAEEFSFDDYQNIRSTAADYIEALLE